MRTLLFVSVLSTMFFVSCSNKDEIDEQVVKEDYSQILAEAQPYISLGMQKLINQLDTVTVPLPIEKVIPFIDKISEKDSLHAIKMSTRTNVDGTTVTSGYSKTTTLFTKKAVTISNSNSSLRESLGYNFKLDASSSSEIVYLTCKAVCNYVYFANTVAFIPAYAENDFMGVNPEAFDANITNNSILEQGYYSDEKVVGKLYYLTTYLFEAYAYNDGGIVIILPSNGLNFSDMEMYCGRFEWRYYAL